MNAHPTVHILEWTDALNACVVALSSHPTAQTITIVLGRKEPQPQLKKLLISSLSHEKVVAAQARPVHPSTLTADSVPQLCTHISSGISVFKAQQLREYLPLLEQEVGPEATPSDFSVFLNRAGYSAVEVPVSETLFPDFVEIPSQQPQREWDAYISHVQNDWQKYHSKPATVFSGLFGTRPRPHVLIDVSGLPTFMNGTARNVTTFLSLLVQKLESHSLDWDVTVVIPRDAQSAFELNSPSITWTHSFQDVPTVFDLGLSLTPITAISQVIFMSTKCARWSVLHLDIIALRALTFLSQNTQARRAVGMYLDYADLIVCISDFSLLDAQRYFGLAAKKNPRFIVIPQGSPLTGSQLLEASQHNGVLVLGNDEPHKQVNIAVDALCAAGIPVTSITAGQKRASLHTAIPTDTLSDEELAQLMSSSSIVVFPSAYEGFGLPIAEATACGKPIIMWDTLVAREVSGVLGAPMSHHFCSSADQIVEKVQSIMENHPRDHKSISTTPLRTIDDFNADLLTALENLVSKPINVELMTHRWNTAQLLQAVIDGNTLRVQQEIAQQHWRKRLSQRRKDKL